MGKNFTALVIWGLVCKGRNQTGLILLSPSLSMHIIIFTEAKKRHLLLFLKSLGLHSELVLHRKGHFHTHTLNLPCVLSLVPGVHLLNKTGGAGVAQQACSAQRGREEGTQPHSSAVSGISCQAEGLRLQPYLVSGVGKWPLPGVDGRHKAKPGEGAAFPMFCACSVRRSSALTGLYGTRISWKD